jgi:hypothetical protein
MINVFLFGVFCVRIFCLQKIISTFTKVQKLFTFDLPYFLFLKKRIRRKHAIKMVLKCGNFASLSHFIFSQPWEKWFSVWEKFNHTSKIFPKKL